ncbi:OmpA family protein [Mucilaginibacter sp. CAU 1740]|uniref:OmpA family protein n=1 Tax=Mucilaginibacter sp. CAU 1740 TaxID=3140365 RepID=UPI00325AD816
MAELDVQPKRSSPWWLWLLIAIIAVVILIFLFRGCNSKTTTVSTAYSTSTTKAVAVTKPDWDAVDFNGARTKDEDVTDTSIAVSGNDRYTIYTLGENILFATDQNTLNSDAGDKLKQIVSSLNKRFKGANIGVYGSTDSTGTAGHNKALGAERAAAVKNWLVTTGGLDSTLVSIHSLGENKPVASNATAAGRQENRNVSIVAFPNK